MKPIAIAVLLAVLPIPTFAQCGMGAVAPGVVAFGNGSTNDASCLIQARLYNQGVGTQITAASTIAPTSTITHVTGGTAINTITVPANLGSGSLILVPDSAINWSAAGNISIAGVGATHIPILFSFDGTKWNPGNIGSGGSGGGALTQISQQVLSSAATSVTFSSIPSTYTNLKLVISAEGTTSSPSGNIALQFNGDTGTNYDTQFLTGTQTTASASSIAAGAEAYVGNLSATGFPTSAEVTIPSYAGTAFIKVFNAENTEGAASNFLSRIASGGIWHNTAAITSITVLELSATDFAIGSTFTLYGMQ